MSKDVSALLRQYADPTIVKASHFAAGNCPSSLDRFHSAFSAPIIYGFVKWVFLRAEQEEIHDLYFLARDGYPLYCMASLLCRQHFLPFQCHYLYGSRMAWRLPSYHFLKEQELRSILFIPSQKMTPSSLLFRAGCTPEEQEHFIRTTSAASGNPYQSFSRQELDLFADELLNRPDFQEVLTRHSQEAYDLTIAYFQQQGLFSKKKFALIDTGWTGSMQRTLRQLLAHAGAFPQLFGFYFGMYEKPKSVTDGQYFTWYLQPGRSRIRAARFNNNLIEALCLAPHPMTIGYRRDKTGRYLPLFAANTPIRKQESDQQEQILRNFAHRAPFDLPIEQWFSITKKLLSRFCTNPSATDVQALQSYSFCDDLLEGYRRSIALPLTKKQLNQYLFFSRLYRRMISKQELPPLFWPEGSLALSNVSGKTRYRLSFFFWELFRQFKLSLKRRGNRL